VTLANHYLQRDLLHVARPQKLKGLQKLSVAVPVASSAPASDFDTELFITDSEALPAVEASKVCIETW
jgi:hypothetical protein